MSSFLRLVDLAAAPPKSSDETIDESPVTPVVSKATEYGKLSWGVAGLLIGTLLDPLTVITMIVIGIFVDNQTMPLLNVTPQEFSSLIAKAVFNWLLHLANRDKPATTPT